MFSFNIRDNGGVIAQAIQRADGRWQATGYWIITFNNGMRIGFVDSRLRKF